MVAKRFGKRARARLSSLNRRALASAGKKRSKFANPIKLMGFRSDGFHVSDGLIAGGLIVSAFIPVSNAVPESSAVGCLMGRGPYASYTWENRIKNALELYCVQTLGVNFKGSSVGYDTKAVGGTAVVTGMAIKTAGTILNGKFLKGSAVKL